MHVAQIRIGQKYRSPQGWIYLVEKIEDGQVHYTVVGGPGDLTGKECLCHITNFAKRMVDFANRQIPKNRPAGHSTPGD